MNVLRGYHDWGLRPPPPPPQQLPPPSVLLPPSEFGGEPHSLQQQPPPPPLPSQDLQLALQREGPSNLQSSPKLQRYSWQPRQRQPMQQHWQLSPLQGWGGQSTRPILVASSTASPRMSHTLSTQAQAADCW